MTETDESESIDHCVWEAFYIPNRWDGRKGHLLAASADSAKKLIAEEADVSNSGWSEYESGAGQPGFQKHRTDHHIVTVVRRRVHGGEGDDSE